MTNPQPMQVRRGGVRRGDHGSFVAPVISPDDTDNPASSAPIGTDKNQGALSSPAQSADAPPGTSTEHAPSTSSDHIGTGSHSTEATPDPTPTVKQDATARAKAAYDARPKVIFRGVEPETDAKLRAIYKHQLHQDGGVEGWSEWGRSVLETFVHDYETKNGPMPSEQNTRLRSGRVKT